MSFPRFLKLQVNGRDITGRDEERPAFIPRAAWRKMVKASLAAAASHWANVYLPLHFSKAAYYRYPDTYTRRTDSYYVRNWIQKTPGQRNLTAEIGAARAAHNPLVFKGTLQLATRLAVLRVFQTRVSVQIQKLPYVVANAAAGKVNILAELGAINSTEIAELGRISNNTLKQAVKQFAANKQLPRLAAGAIPANSGLASLTV